MNTLTSEQFLRHFIGFDRHAANAANFPPHNIVKITEDHYRLTLAVAGFSKNDIQIFVERGTLTILGRKQEEEQPVYLHRGIANRDWDRVFNLGENIEIISASMENGLLEIDLERIVPEELRPKMIPIT